MNKIIDISLVIRLMLWKTGLNWNKFKKIQKNADKYSNSWSNQDLLNFATASGKIDIDRPKIILTYEKIITNKWVHTLLYKIKNMYLPNIY